MHEVSSPLLLHVPATCTTVPLQARSEHGLELLKPSPETACVCRQLFFPLRPLNIEGEMQLSGVGFVRALIPLAGALLSRVSRLPEALSSHIYNGRYMLVVSSVELKQQKCHDYLYMFSNYLTILSLLYP